MLSIINIFPIQIDFLLQNIVANFVAKWRLQFSCTSGVLGLLLNPNNQLFTNRGVVSQISPDSELAENGLVVQNFKRRERDLNPRYGCPHT